MYFDALWSDTDWFWRSAYFSPYVVRFDAPFIRCWMMRTLCSFIARMCFVSDLASFDVDHVSCYLSTGYKCFLFWFFLRRMLTLLDLLLYWRLYVLFWCSFIRCWPNRMFRSFIHRVYVLCFIVLSFSLMEYASVLHDGWSKGCYYTEKVGRMKTARWVLYVYTYTSPNRVF
jgi:hypothetical protein